MCISLNLRDPCSAGLKEICNSLRSWRKGLCNGCFNEIPRDLWDVYQNQFLPEFLESMNIRDGKRPQALISVPPSGVVSARGGAWASPGSAKSRWRRLFIIFQVCYRLRQAAGWRSEITRTRMLCLEAMTDLRTILAAPSTFALIHRVALVSEHIVRADEHLAELFQKIPVGSEHSATMAPAARLVDRYLETRAATPGIRLTSAKGAGRSSGSGSRGYGTRPSR